MTSSKPIDSSEIKSLSDKLKSLHDSFKRGEINVDELKSRYEEMTLFAD